MVSRGGDLNSRPAVYDTAALPLSYLGLKIWGIGGLILTGMYRSRLARLEEKRNTKRVVWMILIMVAVLGSGVVWGVPFLVRVAMFAGAFGSSGQQIDKSDLIPPAPPMLQVDYEATNSANLAVRGWTEPAAEVFLVQNQEPAGSVIAREDGGFVFDRVTLEEGTNDLTAVAVDLGENRSQPSQSGSVYYSKLAPQLSVDHPP